MTEQTESGIAQSCHDFGAIVTMKRAFVLAHGHIFDVMQSVFNGPMSAFQLKQALRDGDRRWQTGDRLADRLFADAFGLPASADFKDLLQARPIGVAFEFRRHPNTSHIPRVAQRGC